jgi:hypothetical protein
MRRILAGVLGTAVLLAAVLAIVLTLRSPAPAVAGPVVNKATAAPTLSHWLSAFRDEHGYAAIGWADPRFNPETGLWEACVVIYPTFNRAPTDDIFRLHMSMQDEWHAEWHPEPLERFDAAISSANLCP